jgi:hypothetical protein
VLIGRLLQSCGGGVRYVTPPTTNAAPIILQHEPTGTIFAFCPFLSQGPDRVDHLSGQAVSASSQSLLESRRESYASPCLVPGPS